MDRCVQGCGSAAAGAGGGLPDPCAGSLQEEQLRINPRQCCHLSAGSSPVGVIRTGVKPAGLPRIRTT